jgi:hypothetical protein
MSLILLFHHLLLNMFRMSVHPSSGACDLLWIYFMCCIALVRYVLVLTCGSAGWCGILVQAEAQVLRNGGGGGGGYFCMFCFVVYIKLSSFLVALVK